ncbi:MAG: oligosaccharide flippase family protein [Lachnospiraceae bacterium]|nr:oligosaccharide flippase family protein [Lachnospiraceae bacterium]
MNEKKRLLRNTGIIAVGNFGAKMISFLLLPLYTSILSTTEYGTYDFIVAASTFLLPIVTMSMHEAMFRFIIDTGREGKKFDEIISNSAFIVLVGVFCSGLIMFGLDRFTNLENVIYIWFYVSANALYSFSNNFLRGLGKIKEYAIISSGKNILQLIINVIVVAVFRWGMHGLLLSMCTSEVLAVLIVVIASKMWRNISLSSINKKQIKEMMAYSLPLIPNALSAQIINISDRIIISTYMGKAPNGIYSVSYKFPNIIETVYHYFYTAWSESASRVFNTGKEKAEKYYQSLLKTVNSFIFSVIICMIAGMPILFRLFIRGDYVSGYSYVPLLMLAMYFDSLSKFYSGIFTALKETKVIATTTVIAAIVNVSVNVLLIGKIGLLAAALSTLIATFVLFVLRSASIGKMLKVQLDVKTIILEVAVCIIILLLYDYDCVWKLICNVIIAGTYSLFSNRSIITSMVKKTKQ